MPDPYTFPESAFEDRDGHDRDGWCHETEAEYRDMVKARWGGGEHPVEAYNVLYAAQKDLEAARLERRRAAEPPLRRHPVTDEILDIMPGVTVDDFLGLPEGMEPTPVVEQRAEILLATLSSRHASGEHPNGGHHYCVSCRGIEAIGSLWRKLTLDIRFDPTTLDPMAKGWVYADGTTDGAEADDEYRLLSIDELREYEAPDMLIDGVLPAQSYGIITGRDGTYKSFLAIDIGCTLAAGLPDWRGQVVGPEEPSTVLFLAGEGAGKFPTRIDSWCEHHGVDVETLGDTFKVMRRVPDLYAGGRGFDSLMKQAVEQSPSLIIVDTLRRASGGADQNGGRDMGLVVDRLHALTEATGATVLVIAHTDKGDNDTRGASNVEDDADFVLHAKRKADPLRQELAVTKMKDGPDDFTSTTYPATIGESIVLTTRAPLGVVWSSTHNRSRVIGALRTLAPQGWASQTEIVNVTGEDDQPLNKGTVSKEINALLAEGGAEKHPTSKQYRITPGWAEPLTDRSDS